MWIKKGLIFQTHHNYEWMVTHSCVPTALILPNDVIRIYFAPRNILGQSIPTFIEVNARNPSDVLYVHNQPIISAGKLGAFDDGGIMPCSIIEHDHKLYLYYVGWNPSVSIPYRNSIGLAISTDGGIKFNRLFDGPIIDRNMLEPYFTASPCVLKENDQWHIWYASTTGFIEVNGKPEPLYVIKYGFSNDGINWIRRNITCINPKSKYEANARPTVIKEVNKYKMWFCYRGSFNYRDGVDSYRIGYAESFDAIHWERKDELAGIEKSEKGWDSKMLAYPNVVENGSKKFLFYNGNGFGLTGIGWAEWGV